MRMSFVRCQACGAKALMAASQCPRCSEPLGLRDDYGKERPLAHCQGCDTYYQRSLGACKWCGTKAPRSSASFAIAAVVLVMLAGGVWAGTRYLQSRDLKTARESATAPLLSMAVSASQLAASATNTPTSTPAPKAPELDSVLPPPVRPETAIPKPARDRTPPPAPPTVHRDAVQPSAAAVVATTSDGDWVSAVSTTWVNVRAHPSRDSGVVMVIGPGSRVQLASSRSSWTRVSAGRTTGWADRRLFAVDALVPR
jgi:SH3 domain-containing protein